MNLDPKPAQPVAHAPVGLAPVALPKQVAQKLVEVADQTLAEALGRAPDAKELAELAEAMTAELLSGAFVMMREQGPEGPKEAEEWLRKTLGTAAAGVRLRGSEAFIKIDVSIRDVPNKIAPKPVPHVDPIKESAWEPSPCACLKDPDGSCPSCTLKLADSYKRLFGYVRDIGKLQAGIRESCERCQFDQLDRALSSAVESLFTVIDRLAGDAKAASAQEILTVLLHLAAAAGVREMPLTIEAWKAAAGERGLLAPEAPP